MPEASKNKEQNQAQASSDSVKNHAANAHFEIKTSSNGIPNQSISGGNQQNPNPNNTPTGQKPR